MEMHNFCKQTHAFSKDKHTIWHTILVKRKRKLTLDLLYVHFCVFIQGVSKNEHLCFPYISFPIKGTENVFYMGI